MRLVFMGTPDFAVPSLDILVKHGFDVAAVVTATDKWGGRGGKQLLESPVKKYAVAAQIPVLQPEKLRDPAFIDALKALNADLFVVVAFRMLPEMVWNMPPKGTMNVHGSLLPKYRGAAPINWAIINGEKETGVTTFFLKHAIDTGDILFNRRLPIEPDDTASSLHDKMATLGAELLLDSVQAVQQNTYTPQPQEDTAVTHAPKIFHDTCCIDFNQSTQKVYNFIRGLSLYPAAWTRLEGLQIKVFKAAIQALSPIHAAGTWVSDGKSFLRVATADGYIDLLDLQMEGRKRLDIRAFLNGFTLPTSVVVV